MQSPLSILFFGTSEFAVPVLEALVHSEHELRAVFTQPDRPAGRGRKLRPVPVAAAAEKLSIPVEKPERIRSRAAIETIRAYAPDAVVLAAYGSIIPKAALEIPRLGWINVHPSLLPRYRGASPVVAPILNGDSTTGVSYFLMREGLDDGPLLEQSSVEIPPDQTAGELEAGLARLSAENVANVLTRWSNGEIQPTPQDESNASYTPKLDKEDARISWELPAEQVHRRVMAYNPWPVAFTFWDDRRLRILRTRYVSGPRPGEPGSVGLDADSGYPLVACGIGAVLLREVQLAGSRAVDGKVFLSGHPDFIYSSLAPNIDS